ncbi:hypothetical protein SLEP1_g23039 [Rubroshorea leprosula]|uniref:Reverse transcriptase Ty1/copia-type domain-containing protein n=1 Tax=Rubroshorea leprosula TaxID=152421 RepID=A0AAV5JM14_9ROSI|nr:hypothetical protein SLEP1_g23039 [Rubroshorea leprosula]
MATHDESPNSAASKNSPNSTTTMLNPGLTKNPLSFNSAAFPVKLTPTNYMSWRAQFTSLLAGYELDGYLDGRTPCPVATAPEYSLWAHQDQLLRHALITSISESITPYIAAAAATAQQAWETLARLYANRSRTRVITLKERLQNMRRDGCSVAVYLRDLKTVADELGTIDRPLNDDDLTVYILNGLGPEFREIAAFLRARDSSLSFDDLHDRLVAHEESLKREENHPEITPVTAHYAAASLNSNTDSSPSLSAGNSNFPLGRHPQQALRPMANFASSSAAFYDDCLLDSGANNHVTTDLANLALHSEYNGPDELHIGDGTENLGYKCLDLSSKKLFFSRHVVFDESTFPHKTQSPVSLLPSDFLPVTATPTTSPPTPNPSTLPSPLDSPASAPHESMAHVVSVLVAAPSPSPPFPAPFPAPSPTPALSSSPSPTFQAQSSPSPSSSSSATAHTLSPSLGKASSSMTRPHPPTRLHQIRTRSLNNIFKPKILFQALSKCPAPITAPTCTWELVPPSPDHHLIGCKWVFRLKRAKDGSIERYKARLVAKGFHQRPGFDFSNTFSPVIKPTTIRTVLSIAVGRGWIIRQLDVNNAFLHGHLAEQLVMQQPAGFVDPRFTDYVCQLRKSIYGLKQAPRAWFIELKNFVLSQGFSQSQSDASLFIYHHGSTWIYFLVYVDDIIITGSDPSAVQSFIQVMGARFSLKDLGPLSFFLGVEAIPTSAGLLLSQHQYIINLLHQYNMHEAKPVTTPLAISPPLHLNYVNKLSQFMHKPMDAHWQAAKRAGDPSTCVSTTGYLVFLGSNPISWRATRQKAVTRSSTEAEYRALAAAASELVWVRNLLQELGISGLGSPALFCDNVGATYLSLNPVLHSCMKHIAMDLHFVRDLVDQKLLHVSHISSHDQLVDVLTKALSTTRFSSLRSKIGVADGTSILRGHVKEGVSPT